MTEKSVLVVYYSSSGNTRKVAQALAERLEADIEEIRAEQPVFVDIKGKGARNFGNMGRVVLGGKLKRRAVLQAPAYNPADYDLVVVGTPVYANTLPPEPRAYLSDQKGQFKTVAFFCTGEAPDNAHVFELMSEACDQAPAAVQPFHAPEIRSETFMPGVESFVAALLAAA